MKTLILILALTTATLALEFIPHKPVVTDNTTIQEDGSHVEENN